MTPAAGPETQVRTGKRAAVSTDISPPFEWNDIRRGRGAPSAAMPRAKPAR